MNLPISKSTDQPTKKSLLFLSSYLWIALFVFSVSIKSVSASNTTAPPASGSGFTVTLIASTLGPICAGETVTFTATLTCGTGPAASPPSLNAAGGTVLDIPSGFPNVIIKKVTADAGGGIHQVSGTANFTPPLGPTISSGPLGVDVNKLISANAALGAFPKCEGESVSASDFVAVTEPAGLSFNLSSNPNTTGTHTVDVVLLGCAGQTAPVTYEILGGEWSLSDAEMAASVEPPTADSTTSNSNTFTDAFGVVVKNVLDVTEKYEWILKRNFNSSCSNSITLNVSQTQKTSFTGTLSVSVGGVSVGISKNWENSTTDNYACGTAGPTPGRKYNIQGYQERVHITFNFSHFHDNVFQAFAFQSGDKGKFPLASFACAERFKCGGCP